MFSYFKSRTPTSTAKSTPMTSSKTTPVVIELLKFKQIKIKIKYYFIFYNISETNKDNYTTTKFSTM